MIAQELEVSLHMAFVEARQKRHEFITVEHLLLALIDNPSAAEALRSCGVKPDALRKDLTNFKDPAGKNVGDIEQANPVPLAAAKGSWAGFGDIVASAASEGVLQLLEQAINKPR